MQPPTFGTPASLPSPAARHDAASVVIEGPQMSPGALERQPRSRPRIVLARRGLALAAFAVWLGGLTFYALVVVPVGTQVLGGPVAQGFVTQAVTVRLNFVA